MILLNLNLIKIHVSSRVRTEGINIINIKTSFLDLDIMISNKSDLSLLNEWDLFSQVTYVNALFTN